MNGVKVSLLAGTALVGASCAATTIHAADYPQPPPQIVYQPPPQVVYQPMPAQGNRVNAFDQYPLH